MRYSGNMRPASTERCEPLTALSTETMVRFTSARNRIRQPKGRANAWINIYSYTPKYTNMFVKLLFVCPQSRLRFDAAATDSCQWTTRCLTVIDAAAQRLAGGLQFLLFCWNDVRSHAISVEINIQRIAPDANTFPRQLAIPFTFFFYYLFIYISFWVKRSRKIFTVIWLQVCM